MKDFISRAILTAGAALAGSGAASAADPGNARQQQRPNILFCVIDDVSYGHWGCYGCDWIKTPGCDFVARRGVRFTNAYTPNAKSGPSRSCILTGLTSWQLGAAANHFAFFPQDVMTFPEVLKENGYTVGMTGKGWFPGEPGTVDGKPRELAGKKYNSIRCTPPVPTVNPIDYAANFRQFLKKRDPSAPFFFWYGGWEAHRPYTYGSGLSDERKPGDVDRVPDLFPDCDIVRTDMCDYGFEIEYFDSHLMKMIRELQKEGLLENTLIVVTSDNGMSFPRIKGQCYYDSHHLPLVMMWPGKIEEGSTIDSFVSFTDFAPTFLAAAGVDASASGMKPFEGKSLLPLLDGTRTELRDHVCLGKERHDIGRPDDAGYPIRAIVADGWLYIRNYEPDRDPAGNPETGFLNYDASPTKTLLLEGRKGRLYRLSFGRRPEEELYDIAGDPDCSRNLARKLSCRALKDSLRRVMEEQLVRDGDPRMDGRGDMFDAFPYSMEVNRNYYNRLVIQGDSIPVPNWIKPSDIDWKRLEKMRKRYR